MGSAFYIYSPAVPLSPSIATPTVGDETYPLVCLTDMAGTSRDRFIEEYRDSVRLQELCAIFVEQAQELEDALCTLMAIRDIGTATDVYLDNIGELLNLPRNGLSDDDYRAFLRAQRASLRSGGRPEDLLTISRLLISDVGTTFTLVEHFPFSVRLVIGGDGLGTLDPNTLFGLLRQAKAQGVRFLQEWWPAGPLATFQFAPANVVVVDANLGFADAAQTTGGQLAGALGA